MIPLSYGILFGLLGAEPPGRQTIKGPWWSLTFGPRHKRHGPYLVPDVEKIERLMADRGITWRYVAWKGGTHFYTIAHGSRWTGRFLLLRFAYKFLGTTDIDSLVDIEATAAAEAEEKASAYGRKPYWERNAVKISKRGMPQETIWLIEDRGEAGATARPIMALEMTNGKRRAA